MSEILKEKLIWALMDLKCQRFVSFGHFLLKHSFKVPNFLYNGRMQQGTSYEYGGVFGENLNLGLIRGLDRG